MEDVLQKAREFRMNYAILSRAHYNAALRNARWNNYLGIPTVIASTVVGASIFATIDSHPAAGWKIAAGLLSLTAALLASLQTFFRFSEKYERHTLAARSIRTSGGA
jgi:hypothetical protein